MKVGDLVRFSPLHTNASGRTFVGTVIEVGVYVGRKDIKVFLSRIGHVSTEMCSHLEVLSERRCLGNYRAAL